MPVLDFNLMKLKNIFGTDPQIAQNAAPMIPQQRSPMPDPYSQHVQNMPVRQEPGMLRKILAATASGLSNIRTPGQAYGDTQAMLDAPYMQQLRDWSVKEQALRQQSLMQDRDEKLRLNQESINRQRERDEQAAEAARLRIELQQHKADLDQKNRDLTDSQKLAQQKQARLDQIEAQLAANQKLEGQRQTGRTELEGVRQTDRKEIEGVRQTGRKEIEGVRQAGRTTLEGTRQGNRVELAKEKGEITRQNKVGVSASGKPLTEDEKRKRLYNNAQQAIIAHPEWKKYIKITGPSKAVDVTKPTSGGFLGFNQSPDENTYNAIKAAVEKDLEPGSSTQLAKKEEPKKDPMGIR